MKTMRFGLCAAALGAALLCSRAGGEGVRLRGSDLAELLRSLPRHNSFEYQSAGALGEGYFEELDRAGEDRGVYLVLSDTRSPAGKLIAFFTGHRYTHVSLSFDRELRTLVSFNGGYGAKPPGLNRESPADLLLSPESSFAVYRIAVSPAQKEAMAQEVRRIDREGSSYNLLGVLARRSFKPNIMFCSQFVHSLLEDAGIELFGKDSAAVRPMDFVFLDREGRLEPLYERQPGSVYFFPLDT
jgi:hypothetical protein